MNDKKKMVRVSKTHHCPVCDKPDWCLVSDDGARAICARVTSPRPAGEAGWLHAIGGDTIATPPPPRPAKVGPVPDLNRFATAAAEQVNRSIGVAATAKLLGITSRSVVRLAVGWSKDQNAYTFPMRDCAGRVIGIRLRSSNGQKWSVRGSRNGLFYPIRRYNGDLMLICEGPTDTAAMMDMIFDAVGRPSCSGGTSLLIDLIKRGEQPRDVAIMADSDTPGIEGAVRLATMLKPLRYVRTCKIVPSPIGKDIREWAQRGADRSSVEQVINSANHFTAK